MNLQQLNEKYHGRTIDFRSWKFPTYGAPPNMGFGFEAQFSDGKIYGVKGKIVVEGMETPSQIRGGKGAFGSLKDVRVVDAYEKEIEGGGDRFAEDIERMLATLFGLPEAKGQSVSTRNNVCPWDLTDVIRRYAKMPSGVVSRDVIEKLVADADFCRDFEVAWEKVKRELVHYIACKFSLAEPENLADDYGGRSDFTVTLNGSEIPKVAELRARMLRTICSGSPSWSRSMSWVSLRNEMLDQVFDGIGVKLPPQAHELMYMYNGRKPTSWDRVVAFEGNSPL